MVRCNIASDPWSDHVSHHKCSVLVNQQINRADFDIISYFLSRIDGPGHSICYTIFNLFILNYLVLVGRCITGVQKLGHLKSHMATHSLNGPPQNTSEQVKFYMCDASDLISGFLIVTSVWSKMKVMSLTYQILFTYTLRRAKTILNECYLHCML